MGIDISIQCIFHLAYSLESLVTVLFGQTLDLDLTVLLKVEGHPNLNTREAVILNI